MHPVGTYNIDLTLVYANVITNIGRAYNSITGNVNTNKLGCCCAKFSTTMKKFSLV